MNVPSEKLCAYFYVNDDLLSIEVKIQVGNLWMLCIDLEQQH